MSTWLRRSSGFQHVCRRYRQGLAAPFLSRRVADLGGISRSAGSPAGVGHPPAGEIVARKRRISRPPVRSTNPNDW